MMVRQASFLPPDEAALCALAEEALRLVAEIRGRYLEMLMQEQVWVLALDQGTVGTTPVRNAELLRPAILCGASGIVVVHNHPTGDPEPSPDDVKMTETRPRLAR